VDERDHAGNEDEVRGDEQPGNAPYPARLQVQPDRKHTPALAI
jgi:hypothetical protein